MTIAELFYCSMVNQAMAANTAYMYRNNTRSRPAHRLPTSAYLHTTATTSTDLHTATTHADGLHTVSPTSAYMHNTATTSADLHTVSPTSAYQHTATTHADGLRTVSPTSAYLHNTATTSADLHTLSITPTSRPLSGHRADINIAYVHCDTYGEQHGCDSPHRTQRAIDNLVKKHASHTNADGNGVARNTPSVSCVWPHKERDMPQHAPNAATRDANSDVMVNAQRCIFS